MLVGWALVIADGPKLWPPINKSKIALSDNNNDKNLSIDNYRR